MPRRKPLGWPDLMTGKRLKTGAIGYYWAPPTRAKRAGCPVAPEALGTNYGIAKQRCDEVLNKYYRAWLRGEPETEGGPAEGTWNWLVSVYKASPRYKNKPAGTRKSYDRVLGLVSDHRLTDGRTFGQLHVNSITPAAADLLIDKLRHRPNGGERPRTALLAMQAARRAWNVTLRSHSKTMPAVNPFSKMELEYTAAVTTPATYNQLMSFVAKADELGERSIGTAALIAFNWLQRQVDIRERLAWSYFRPADAPDSVRVFHQKTGVLMDVPLYDLDGSDLWPDLTPRLDEAERHGTLIVTRDQPDRFRGVHLPWRKRHFARRVAAISKAAGIPAEIKFMGLRHGGNTEGADASLTDAQLRALSGHKSQAALLRYAQASVQQRRDGARKRRDSRTKRGNLSE